MANKDFDLKGILKVREANEDDANNLQEYCFPDQTKEDVANDLKADLAEDSQKTRLVAESSNYAVGHISVKQHPAGSNVGQISDLAVAGPFRLLGVADHLIASAEATAADKGMEILEIELTPDEKPVIQRYKDWGFSEKPIVTLQKTIKAEAPTEVEEPDVEETDDEEEVEQEEDDTDKPDAEKTGLFGNTDESEN